jgi:hypothetical protein
MAKTSGLSRLRLRSTAACSDAGGSASAGSTVAGSLTADDWISIKSEVCGRDRDLVSVA